jgi:glycosyltransferase involved in cell wall biosynthesis
VPVAVTRDPHLPVPASVTSATKTATVLVPAYNEEDGLATVLEQLAPLRAIGVDVLVVDDGSRDRTAAVGRDAGCRVVERPQNGGKGAAIRSGLRAIATDRVVVMDADGTYPVHAIPAMLRLLEDHDIVLGARTIGRNNIPLLNRLGNAALRLAIRAVSGFRSADPLTGLYALRLAQLEALGLRSNGFGIEAEIAIKSAHLGLRSVDHPIAYGARIGSSKLHPLRDGLSIARTILTVGLAARTSRRHAERRRGG